MSLIVKQAEYVKHPEGFPQAVCVDVVDLGMQETAYGQKHKVKIVWETTELMEDGRPFTVQTVAPISLDPRSNLRKTLESWRGCKFTAEELKGFDLESLLNVNAQIQIIHDTDAEGKEWANVQTVVPLSGGMEPIKPSGHYVRVKDRAPKGAVSGAQKPAF